MLGPDQPVILQMLEITPALDGLRGVAMELEDCAFPLLAGMVQTDDPDVAFGDVDVALLVGAMPRKEGMERADLLSANGGIFKPQGKALSRSAQRDVKVLVVGNPANTNALIAQHNAKDLDPRRFTAMTRLDHNRAIAQLAAKAGRARHRHHQDDDLGQPLGHPVPRRLPRRGRRHSPPSTAVGADQAWLEDDFIPTVQQRGAAIIKARGLSSAASAANAAIDHVRSWVLGTPEGDWVSMGVVSDGSYGVPEGIISSFPCTCPGRRVLDRPGPRDRRLQPGPHRHEQRRAGRGARRRRPSSASSERRPGAPSPAAYLRNLLVVLSARTLPPVWQVGQ